MNNTAKPRRFDANLIVIGAGSAGLVSAYLGAALRAKVVLIERDRMGGDCLHTGCVPSKALIRSARFIADTRRATEFGMRSATVEFDFADLMARIQGVIQAIEPHDSIERYEGLGVEVIAGDARIVSPYCVAVNGREITARAIIIAAGAQPLVPSITGLEKVDFLTSENLWQLRELPARLVVLGGGPIGCELAQCFARFGSEVTQVEMLPRILAKDDADAARLVAGRLRADGVDLRTSHRALEVRLDGDRRLLRCQNEQGIVEFGFDRILVAVGRVAKTAGYGLDDIGIELTPGRTVQVDAAMQTRYASVFACGDVAGPYQFTHSAAHQAWYATVNALFGGWHRFNIDYAALPWATFTDPEVATVGLTEQIAGERNIACEITRYDFEDLDRALTDSDAEGFVKVLTVPGKDRILGATIVGAHAGDLITEFTLAIRHGLGLNKILSTIHPYPTWPESAKFAAGVWRRAHAPQRLLGWLARYHHWRRG